MSARDPFVVLNECADLVPGTMAEERLRWESYRIASGWPIANTVARLRERARLGNLYTSDECEAMRLACEEIVR